MNLKIFLVGLLTASTSRAAVEREYSPSFLRKLGIKMDVVSQAFREAHNIELDQYEKLRVTKEEEGQNLRFDTLDEYSISVPIHLAYFPEAKYPDKGK